MKTSEDSVPTKLSRLAPVIGDTRVIVHGVTTEGLIFSGELNRIEPDCITVISDDPDVVLPIANIRELNDNFVRPLEFINI